MKFFFCLVFGLSAVAPAFAQEIKPFSEAKGYGVNAAVYDFDKWNFLMGDAAYEIQKTGKVIRKDAKDRILIYESNLTLMKISKGLFISPSIKVI